MENKTEPMQKFLLGGYSRTTPKHLPQGGTEQRDLVDSATKLAEDDRSERWDVDMAAILQAADGTFIYATASGCSCWEGDWYYEQYATFDDLARGIRYEDRKYNVGWSRSDKMLAEAAKKLGIEP